MGWEFYLIFALLVGVSYILAPDPPKTPPAGLDTIKACTAEEGREIPILFGSRRIRSANVIWYGDMNTEAIKSSGSKK